MSTQQLADKAPSLTAPEDVLVRYPVESGHRHSTWVVECGHQTAFSLEMPAGIYTLTQLLPEQEQAVKAAERLCALVAHPAVLTVTAVSSSGKNDQIWHEPAEAGTLADYCAAKGQLPLEQVSKVAHDLCTGITYLHENHLSYSELTGNRVVFTVNGDLKLLAPDLDLRSVPQSVLAKHRAQDTAAVAALLWLCLTGEVAAPQRFRKPLSLSVPSAGETLAKTLEDAIDSRSEQPTLQEIAALFELSRDPAPLELHLSAHESVLSRLPAIRPTRYDPVPKGRFKRKPVVLGQLQDFSAPPPPKGFKKTLGSAAGKKPFTLAALALVALGAGALALNVAGGTDSGQNSVTVATGAGGESSAGVDLPEPSSQAEVSQQKVGAEDGHLGSPDAGEYAELFTSLIDTRSRVLSAGTKEGVGEYAVVDSELYLADQGLIEADTEGRLAGMSTRLAGLESVQENGATVEAVLLVEAQGYTPQGSDEELARSGMQRQGDSLFQRVTVTAQQDGEKLLMVSAVPVANVG